MENQIMTSNNSIQLYKLESIGNEKKGMCYICKKLNPNAKFDNIKPEQEVKGIIYLYALSIILNIFWIILK